jgi:hypothetical protein
MVRSGLTGENGSGCGADPSESLPHTCPLHYELPAEEWLLVLDGNPTVREPDGEYRLEPMDVAFFAPGPRGAHQVRNDSTETARLLMWGENHYPAAAIYPDSTRSVSGLAPGRAPACTASGPNSTTTTARRASASARRPWARRIIRRSAGPPGVAEVSQVVGATRTFRATRHSGQRPGAWRALPLSRDCDTLVAAPHGGIHRAMRTCGLTATSSATAHMR